MALAAREQYEDRLRDAANGIEASRATERRSICFLIIACAAFLVVLFEASQNRLPAWTLVIPLPAVVLAGRVYGDSRSRSLRLLRIKDFYERGVRRLEDNWVSSGFTGEAFREDGHIYDTDLRILGEGSLFELLCTARTGIGRRRLAGYLLHFASNKEALGRQTAVRELLPDLALRENIGLLGKFDFQESSWGAFAEWMAAPVTRVHPSIRLLALVSSIIVGGLLLAPFVTSLTASALLSRLPAFLILQAAIVIWFWKPMRRIDESARRLGVEIGVIREGIDLISTKPFRTPGLRALQDTLRDGDARSALRRLERLTNALAELDKPWFAMPGQALMLRTQVCFAIEAWKKRFTDHLSAWIEAWAEFEVLAAISGYAYEHPRDVFPEFREGDTSFIANGLGHPLLSDATCVRNDVRLDATYPFFILSGSNMSGKSTLLRAIGLNVVLARAGAPVRASSLELSALEVCASLSLVDSVLEGKSKFFAEIERVRETIERAGQGPVLFLIDEILSGTNSHDRGLVAGAIAAALRERGAIGAISTHDLALTMIEGGTNVHMSATSEDRPLDFDYVLKPGPATGSNAVAIAEMMGVPMLHCRK